MPDIYLCYLGVSFTWTSIFSPTYWICVIFYVKLRREPTSSGRYNWWLIVPVSGLFPEIEYPPSQFLSMKPCYQSIWRIPLVLPSPSSTTLSASSILVHIKLFLVSSISYAFLFIFMSTPFLGHLLISIDVIPLIILLNLTFLIFFIFL